MHSVQLSEITSDSTPAHGALCTIGEICLCLPHNAQHCTRIIYTQGSGCTYVYIEP